VLRTDRDAAGFADVIGNHGSQLGLALRGAIVGPTLVKGVLRGRNDVSRGRKIRLPNFQVNDATALCFEGASAHKYFERGLDPDAAHPRGEFHICF
jgi:hypothetical protein